MISTRKTQESAVCVGSKSLATSLCFSGVYLEEAGVILGPLLIPFHTLPSGAPSPGMAISSGYSSFRQDLLYLYKHGSPLDLQSNSQSPLNLEPGQQYIPENWIISIPSQWVCVLIERLSLTMGEGEELRQNLRHQRQTSEKNILYLHGFPDITGAPKYTTAQITVYL